MTTGLGLTTWPTIRGLGLGALSSGALGFEIKMHVVGFEDLRLDLWVW